MNNNPAPDSYLTLTVLSLVSTCGIAVLLLAPLVTGGLVTTLGFSDAQAGYVISVELAGVALVSIPAALWIGRFNWQHVLYLMLLVLIAANMFTTTLDSFTGFLLVRFITGVATGLTGAVTMSVINLSRDPDRSLGYWFSLQLLATVVGLALLPRFIAEHGLDKLYLMLALFQTLLLFTVRLIPARGRSELSLEKLTTPVLRMAIPGFAALVLFEAAVMGTWTYYERIGHAAGLSTGDIAIALSAGNFLGFLGSVSTALLSTRYGRLPPITVGMGLGVTAILILGQDFSLLLYVFSACAFCFCWYFTLPYLMATMASIDPSGRLLIFCNFITGAGLTLGPALAARLQSSGSYDAVIVMGISFLLLAWLLIIRLALHPVPARD